MAESEDYLRGFVHGMHFVLLALEGRLMAAAGKKGETEKVFAEYHRLVADYRTSIEKSGAAKAEASDDAARAAWPPEAAFYEDGAPRRRA